MAYIIDSTNNTQTMHDGNTTREVYTYQIIVESAEDLGSLDDGIGVGSLAYTVGFGNVWQKDFDGNWVEVVLE